jgi:hypothetical protein
VRGSCWKCGVAAANTKVKKQRLHSLAESFLRITGQEKQHPAHGIEIGNRAQGGVTLTM